MTLEEYSEESTTEDPIEVTEIEERPIMPQSIIDRKNQTAETIRRVIEALYPANRSDIWDYKNNKLITFNDLIDIVTQKNSKNRIGSGILDSSDQKTVNMFVLSLTPTYEALIKIVLNEIESFILYVDDLSNWAGDINGWSMRAMFIMKTMKEEMDVLSRGKRDYERIRTDLLNDASFTKEFKENLSPTIHVNGELMPVKEEHREERREKPRVKRDDKGAGF